MDSKLSGRLTERQAEVAFRPFQTMSVFAAPGSGKTTVLTEHIRFQLVRGLLRPAEIMAVTFSKQAANEMAIRIQGGYTHEDRSRIQAMRIGTFHAQMFGLLLAQDPNIPVLLDPSEQFQMMKSALQLQSLRDTTEAVHKALMMLTRWRSSWPVKAMGSRRERRLAAQYQLLKLRSHRWDFDDILVRTCEILETGKTFGFQKPVRYILVDEFQDTNDIQWTILQYLVSLLDAKLFVVGDDDQSIYGFRGANPMWLINFGSWFPKASSQTLTINFRSDTAIVQSAKHLIDHNHNRQAKDTTPYSTEKGLVRAFQWNTEETESAFVASALFRQSAGGPTAVLARTRKQLERTWSLLPKRLRRQMEFRTFHAAKGREWNTVHILGAVEHNPYLSAESTETLCEEEERRLFYVAMTRARHELYIHSPLHLKARKSRPSRFVRECQPDG